MALPRAAIASMVLWALPAAAVEPGAAADDCRGCSGHGSSSSGTSGGLCEGVVDITVVGVDGRCGWLWNDLSKRTECRRGRGCSMTITRTWRGFPPDLEIDHCVRPGARELCLTPRPTSGVGCGRTVRKGPQMDCAPEGRLRFAVSSGACDMTLEVESACSRCTGRT